MPKNGHVDNSELPASYLDVVEVIYSFVSSYAFESQTTPTRVPGIKLRAQTGFRLLLSVELQR